MDDETLICKVTDDAQSKIDKGTSLLALAELERVVMIVISAQGIIDNGGFQYFYEMNWDETPPYSLFVDTFRAIDAGEAADCIEETAAMFPFTDPHLDQDARNAFLDALEDRSRFEELGDRVSMLYDDTTVKLAAYIRKHQPAE